MPDTPIPMTFTDAIEWIGSLSGHYAMKVVGADVVISVVAGLHRTSAVAASTSETDLQAALVRAARALRSA